MTFTELVYQLTLDQIPFSVTYSGENNEYYVVHVDGPVSAIQLKVLTELRFNFAGGQFHLMGELT